MAPESLCRSRPLGRLKPRFLGMFLFLIVLIFYLKKFRVTNKTNALLISAYQNEVTVFVKRQSPQKNILFLKTHKTGSSTISNILNRYGERKNLKIALPQDGMFNFFWPFPFQVSFAKPMKGKPNILCNHARYNKKTMRSFMLHNATFITILRNPLGQFESVFSYMEFQKVLGLEDEKSPMNVFLANPQDYFKKLTANPDALVAYPYLNLLRNGQFFDLGLESPDFYDNSKITEAIRQIDEDFNLVLIMEYFDESLVLLTRELGWSVEDVVYFKQNQRQLSDKTSVFSKELKVRLLEWSSADFLLYDYFNKTLWTKIGKQDRRFWTELNLLKSYNMALEQECLEPGEHVGKVYEKQSKNVQGFKLKMTINDDLFKVCQRMVTNELDYMKYLRTKAHYFS